MASGCCGNYNLLDDGQHIVRAFADGAQCASANSVLRPYKRWISGFHFKPGQAVEAATVVGPLVGADTHLALLL